MTDADPAADSITEFAGGDPAGGRALRASLTALLELDLDDRLRGRITAVLRGDASMRDLGDDPALRSIADEGIVRLRAQLDDLSPEARADLVARARERLRETETS